MQVHKESIDKIPNSLSNRNNVDIEIYGMEGIPEHDLREHDRIKNNDSVEAPRPVAPPPAIPGVPPAMPPPPSMVPNMNFIPSQMPPRPPFAPPVMPPIPFGAPPFPPMSVAGMFQPNSLLPPPPLRPPPSIETSLASNVAPKPLFPSAAATSSTNVAPISEASNANVGKIVTILSNSRIMHPEEDLSLEELRIRLPRYRGRNLESYVPSLFSNEQRAQPPVQGTQPQLHMPPHLHPPPPRPPMLPPQFQPTFRSAY